MSKQRVAVRQGKVRFWTARPKWRESWADHRSVDVRCSAGLAALGTTWASRAASGRSTPPSLRGGGHADGLAKAFGGGFTAGASEKNRWPRRWQRQGYSEGAELGETKAAVPVAETEAGAARQIAGVGSPRARPVVGGTLVASFRRERATPIRFMRGQSRDRYPKAP